MIVNYIKAGFDVNDIFPKSLEKRTVTVIGGRPGTGKTEIELGLIKKLLAEEKESAMIFSLESSKQTIIKRLAGMNFDIDKYGSSIFVDDTKEITTSEIRDKIEALGEEIQTEISVVFVDFMQLLGKDENCGGSSREDQMKNAVYIFKKMAQDLNISVVLLSQLSRTCEARTGSRPIVDDLLHMKLALEMVDHTYLLYRE